jgi:hypothetical protein
MHLVKWIRKNTRKIMVIVIFVIMGMFILGSTARYLFDSIFNPNKRVVATLNGGNKISVLDLRFALNELNVLRGLMADRLLMAQSAGGISGPLLVHLLFPESPFSSQIAPQMKQAVQQGQIPITEGELDEFFQQRSERPEILWLLLKREAYQAGYIIPTDSAGQTLLYTVPQMTGNQFDAAGLVNQIISANNITEEQILRILADLMGVTAYAEMVMDSQSVTINQIKASLGRSKERVDAEFVKIEAKPLIDEDAEIAEAQVQQQFVEYKMSAPGTPSADNPYGFGYKLPKRVQLEYMVVLMDDVNKQVESPTAEALEEYYSSNITKYQVTEPSDPDDPESEKIFRTRSFAEVEAEIRRTLKAEKASTQANILFNEIKDKTEGGFETLNFEEASTDELQKAAGNYVAVSDALSEKYNIPIVSGKTGWLDAATFGQDKILTNLGIRRGQNYLRLSDLAFTAAEDKPRVQRIGIPSIRVWENIGPLSGGYYSGEDSTFYRLMALVRVVGIKESAVPDNVAIAFETQGILLDDSQLQGNSSFSLINHVKDDIRLLAAMDAATARAEELAGLISDQGWDAAIKAYNSRHTDDDEIALGSVKQQLRISQAEVEIAKRMMLLSPGSAQYLQQRIVSNMLTNRLYAMLPEDAKTTGIVHIILPFEPQAACYVVKEVVRQPATIADYTDNKAQTALQLSAAESIGLGLVHLSPENILERMSFKPKLQEDAQEETAAKEEQEG